MIPLGARSNLSATRLEINNRQVYKHTKALPQPHIFALVIFGKRTPHGFALSSRRHQHSFCGTWNRTAVVVVALWTGSPLFDESGVWAAEWESSVRGGVIARGRCGAVLPRIGRCGDHFVLCVGRRGAPQPGVEWRAT